MTSLENSMPMTTTLMNRMSKRKDMVVGTKYIIKQQRLSEPTDQVCSIHHHSLKQLYCFIEILHLFDENSDGWGGGLSFYTHFLYIFVRTTSVGEP